MYLPNDVARCANALDMNCQFRNNCKRWVYRKPRKGEEANIVWSDFAHPHVGEGLTGGICLYQIRID